MCLLAAFTNTVYSAIHRGDYQKVLLKAAVDLGATVMTHAEAKNVETSVDSQTIVTLGDGKQLQADAVVGADGRCRFSQPAHFLR